MSPWTKPTATDIRNWSEQRNVRKLIQALADPESSHSLLIFRSLEEIGIEAVPNLLDVLRTEKKNTDLLCNVVDLLSLMGAEETLPHLFEIIERIGPDFGSGGKSTYLWVSCIDALGRIGTTESLDFLEKVAEDDSHTEEQRRRAIESLAMAGRASVTERLSALYLRLNKDLLKVSSISGLVLQGEHSLHVLTGLFMDEENPDWRSRIVRIIGDNQARAYIPRLIDWLEEEHKDVVRDILWALGEIGDTKAYAPLKLRFSALTPDVKIAAAEALAKLGWIAGEEESIEIRTYCALGAGRIDEALRLDDPSSPILQRYFFERPRALVEFTYRTRDDKLWWEVMDKLITRNEGPIVTALDTLLRSEILDRDSRHRISLLKSKINP